ncbi:hypothetical protein NPIL_311511 [Nephila pilipes]|uniref:Uncharacterized protein n=1 Tax=Nephila pilipes TaxID=299642 RepID=A0A8X6P230_NEPPI|nr:hypothetical protein NPIL_311511 [Nephila pilipes]
MQQKNTFTANNLFPFGKMSQRTKENRTELKCQRRIVMPLFVLQIIFGAKNSCPGFCFPISAGLSPRKIWTFSTEVKSKLCSKHGFVSMQPLGKR